MEGLKKIISDDGDIVKRINSLTKQIKSNKPDRFKSVFGFNSGDISPDAEVMLNVSPEMYFVDEGDNDKVIDLMPPSKVGEERAKQISDLLDKIDDMAIEDADNLMKK